MHSVMAWRTAGGRYDAARTADCGSYETAHWLGISPLKILSVTFADGSAARHWAVVSDLGGAAEVTAACSTYGGPFCTYPWFAGGTNHAITYGADYPGTTHDYGGSQGAQFATTPLCGGPFGPDSTFCDKILTPSP